MREMLDCIKMIIRNKKEAFGVLKKYKRIPNVNGLLSAQDKNTKIKIEVEFLKVIVSCIVLTIILEVLFNIFWNTLVVLVNMPVGVLFVFIGSIFGGAFTLGLALFIYSLILNLIHKAGDSLFVWTIQLFVILLCVGACINSVKLICDISYLLLNLSNVLDNVSCVVGMIFKSSYIYLNIALIQVFVDSYKATREDIGVQDGNIQE